MPNMDFDSHDTWYPDPTDLDDDVFTFVYIGENANLKVGMVDTTHRSADDLAILFPDAIYFLAHVQEV